MGAASKVAGGAKTPRSEFRLSSGDEALGVLAPGAAIC